MMRVRTWHAAGAGDGVKRAAGDVADECVRDQLDAARACACMHAGFRRRRRDVWVHCMRRVIAVRAVREGGDVDCACMQHGGLTCDDGLGLHRRHHHLCAGSPQHVCARMRACTRDVSAGSEPPSCLLPAPHAPHQW